MLFRRFITVMLVLFAGGTAFAAESSDLQVAVSKPGAKVSVDRVVKDGTVVVSVFDAGESPVFGLGAADFSVTQSGRTADIVSVQPLAESLEVPRHIVLVLDNSYSMEERRAINALLRGVDELLKIVRPIDQVHVVVFENFKTVNMGGYKLSVQVFKSSQPAELRQFAASAYSPKTITGKTVLKDAMLAGLELIGEMPETEPRFMVVFSDGEDLNSVYSREDVLKEAQKLKGFNAYAIDYMPGPATDKFLSEFTGQNRGQIWKARTENDLVTIFQDVASKMQYYYVVSYQFPPKGSLGVAPSALRFDEISISGAAPVTNIDVSALTLTPVVDSVYGIASWTASVSNAGGGVAELSGQGAPAPELKIPLPASDLKALAAGGDISVKMELTDNKGQRLAMDAAPVRVEVIKTTAGLSVSPASLSFDEVLVSGAAPVVRTDESALTLRPDVVSPHGIASWSASVSNAGGSVSELSGQGAPAPEVEAALPADSQALAAGGDISVKMELLDSKGHSLVVNAPPVKVEVLKTTAGLSVVPSTLTIEEIRTIDASPMLGHVFFDKGSNEIPAQYVRLAGPEETAGFDEQKFRDALEKYYQVLNIVGKRLTANPEATVTLVGCNDNTGEERKNKKLSTARAEAVRDYLQTVWGILPERITVEARNLPEMPSAIKLYEGQAENRRVEIRSTEPAITAPIQSTYFTNRIDAPELSLRPEVVSPHGIASWKADASNSAGRLADLSAGGAPAKDIGIPTAGWDLGEIAAGGDITVKMELRDRNGQDIALTPVPVKVNFIQTSQRLARKEGLRVQEKYALILFDFDKDTIGAFNQEVINRIADRVRTLPEATVDIVGHTDNIGREGYNIKLSERRALAAYNLLKAAYDEDPGERLRYSGVGAADPLYDNRLPEGRSFNRTVTITLEYMSAE